MEVRLAAREDAGQACEVVRASIAELCSLDHKGDPAILEAWLANKTVENFAQWIDDPGNHMFVADQAGVVLGAGCVKANGEVVLNYVSPRARFQGVSGELLDAMERQASSNGNIEVMLDSTATARAFYLRRGYDEGAGEQREKFGLVAFPMRKRVGGPS